MSRTVIIGASHAGVTAAESLRRGGYEGEIVLLSGENHLPYHRPPLSKAFLTGEKTAAQIALRGEAFYAQNKIDLRLGAGVSAVDGATKTLTIEGQAPLPYTTLILATGAAARRLPQAEGIASGIHYLRDLSEAESLRSVKENAKSIAIIGGGFIGLEVAATMVKSGLHVTVIEALPALLRRALPASISDFLAEYHRKNGVDLRLNTTIESLNTEDGKLTSITLAGGETVAVEAALVGIGSVADMTLARQLGLDEWMGGIKVDGQGRSSAPDVYAIGDCATQFNATFGDYIRIESVQAAADQARATAAAILNAASPLSSSEILPWFWSDQYDLKLQMAGFVQADAAEIQRGAPSAEGFSVMHLQDTRLSANFSVNRAGDHIGARKLISQNAQMDLERLADVSLPVAQCQRMEAAE